MMLPCEIIFPLLLYNDQTMADTDQPSDEAVVKRVQEGYKQEYRTIVNRFEAKLLRYASYLVRDKEQAADVVQNAFIKAFINLQGFNTKRKFSSWLYRIVHNEAINEIKKHRREISLEDNDWIKEIKSDDDSIEETLDKKEAAGILKESLDKIPVNYRESLTLYYLEDKSYEEISDILHLPLGTVGTRLARGKTALKKVYERSRTQ
ncbi:MAG: RNA polymerase sigma factor [Patescibacteria group bacterium]